MPEFKAIYIKKINADRDDAIYIAKLLKPKDTELVQIVEDNKEYFELEN